MRHAKRVRLETAPTGPDTSGSKPRGEGGAGWTAEGFCSVGAGDFGEGVIQIRNSVDRSDLNINLIFNVTIDVFAEIDNND